ncbi:MAG: hypothetical protein ACTSO2_19415 [Promethearchaeota archaeon]
MPEKLEEVLNSVLVDGGEESYDKDEELFEIVREFNDKLTM